MNKILLTVLVLVLSILHLEAQIDISEARSMPLGTTVTIEGIVTNGDELGIIRYLQDGTGAIPAYPGTGSAANFPESVKRGDEIQVTGVLKDYNGLLEIDPITSFSVITNDNTIPSPLEITPNGVNEANEAKLVTISGATFSNGGGLFSTGNYTFTAGGETSEIYVRTNHPLIGTTIPLASVNITGIASQFMSQYQVLPRDVADIQIADAFYFANSPLQSDITSNGFKVTWETNVAGSTALRYGTTPAMENEIDMGGSATSHSITLNSLDAAEFYYIQAFSNNGNSTINSATRLFSTASNSSGNMLVYFNFDVDGSYSDGNYPSGTTPGALEAAIINRINSATSTIDVSVYNINRTTIVEALSNAHNNGVQVRYIADDQTANLALQNPTPPFSILKGNAGDPLMHNKFFVFDADSQDDSWVIMGSTNMTSQNIATDYNNMVFIQDQTLAKAYTIEFEEMWGSDEATPGVFNVKFGDDKADNTPHLFNVNGVMIESYFSPSDNTTIAITNAINTVDDDLSFALLTFTKNELGNAVLSAHNSGASVRGIINNTGDQGSEYPYLLDNGVNVASGNTDGQIHHKYCIIDATNTNSDPMVVTGSHNWSNSADVRNDENTLIIHDAAIANIFQQEFEARWCERTMGTNCITSTNEVNEIEGFEVNLYPNPAVDLSTVEMDLEEEHDVIISLWDMNGRMVHSRILRNIVGNTTEPLQLSGMPAGTYLVTFTIDNKRATRQLQIVR